MQLISIIAKNGLSITMLYMLSLDFEYLGKLEVQKYLLMSNLNEGIFIYSFGKNYFLYL
jgi:hypothetical protein